MEEESVGGLRRGRRERRGVGASSILAFGDYLGGARGFPAGRFGGKSLFFPFVFGGGEGGTAAFCWLDRVGAFFFDGVEVRMGKSGVFSETLEGEKEID